jgi:hypothetical protein
MIQGAAMSSTETSVVKLTGLNLSPSQFDYLCVSGKVKKGDSLKNRVAVVRVEAETGDTATISIKLGQDHVSAGAGNAGAEWMSIRLRLPLSSYWRFHTIGKIRAIAVELPAPALLAIYSVELVPAKLLAPALTVLNGKPGNDGIYLVDRSQRGERQAKNIAVSVDARTIATVRKIELEVLKMNFFFDNLEDPKQRYSSIDRILSAPGNSAVIELPESLFQSSGFIQVRARSLDAGNRLAGAPSWPVTFRVVRD